MSSRPAYRKEARFEKDRMVIDMRFQAKEEPAGQFSCFLPSLMSEHITSEKPLVRSSLASRIRSTLLLISNPLLSQHLLADSREIACRRDCYTAFLCGFADNGTDSHVLDQLGRSDRPSIMLLMRRNARSS